MTCDRLAECGRVLAMVGGSRVLVVASALGVFSIGCEGGPTQEATEAAVHVAAGCGLVTDALGAPLEGSWSGSRQRSGLLEAHGRISGPEGSAELEFEAIRSGDTWNVTRGFVVAGGSAIDIVECEPLGEGASR